MRILDASGNLREAAVLLERRRQFNREIEGRVRQILEDVRTNGDEALTTLTRQLDCKFIDSLGLGVSERDVRASYQHVSREFLSALRVAMKNIRAFHRRQKPASWTLRLRGASLQQRIAPLRRVGIYIPGGKAAYPSTVLMNAIPAAIAGVGEMVMVTPCNGEGRISPEVLVAAAECGIKEIYRVGGAQAVAALAYGTESIRRVDKITGPGNAYVAAAKRMVFGEVGIDMIAGPTEVVIVADKTARADFIAADLIAQAEHDELASPICVTTSPELAARIAAEVATQLESLPRKAVAQRAFEAHGAVIRVASLEQAAEIVNELAPEHLEVMTRNARRFAAGIRNAGSIFLGPWSTEALGDYAAGPNHTLPTSGTARFSSPLGVHDFMKFSNIIEVSKRRFLELAPAVEVLAGSEGLHGHAASAQIRYRKKNSVKP